MATLGRYEEIILFLDSLANQSYKNFELIIVDQNDDNKIEKLCLSYSMDIRVIKSAVKGLSINRNIGLKYVSGDIIAFPDDDCEYDSQTLEKVMGFFNKNPDYSFYTCNTKEKQSELSILPNTLNDTHISVSNIMHTGISFTIFIRREKIHNFKFDELLGVGAEFGSGEESDLLLFLLKNKNKGFYHSKDYIFHPHKPVTAEKAFQYGKGYGALHKKAIVKYGFYMLFVFFLHTLLKETVKMCIYPHSAERIATMRGRIYGFLHYKSRNI
jgi:glycosyltransferase involved in cell wall biosynthesis